MDALIFGTVENELLMSHNTVWHEVDMVSHISLSILIQPPFSSLKLACPLEDISKSRAYSAFENVSK